MLKIDIDDNYMEKFISSIVEYGFDSPRPIQCTTIGRIAKGGDIIAQAKAGNGKTGAFVIGACLQVDVKLKKTQILILSPTKELTDQTATVVRNLTKHTGIIVHCYRGGLEYPADNKVPHIIVGCPGRINDMLRPSRTSYNNRCRINLQNIKTLIMDEGDELLKPNFKDQVKLIVEMLEENTQICLFSATLPKSILDLCNRFMINPSYVILPDNQVITELVTQWYYKCSNMSDKENSIIDALYANNDETIIIFFNSCKILQDISNVLLSLDTPIEHICIHGKMDPLSRTQSIKDFTNRRSKILLASDLAARGLDIPNITLVINYDIPYNMETYVHRIGRSGRGSQWGDSITLIVSEEDKNKIKTIVDIHGLPIKCLKQINKPLR
jgi:superfamily II DNA/RNA helicase